jgi:hypothetical protein
MKKFLFASAAAAAMLVSAPAFAGSGFVDFSYSRVDDADLNDWSLGGAAVTDVMDGWSLQGDAHMHRLDAGGSNINFGEGTLHLFQRTDAHAFGGYFGASDLQGIGAYGIGLEGAMYMDQFTVSGNLGYDWLESFGTTENGWSAGINGKFFVNDNFSIDAGVRYADFDVTNVTTWNIGAEFKPESMPVSFYADYRNHNSDSSFLIGDDYNAWTLGVRWNIGGGSLKSRDRTGASMKGGSAFTGSIF